MLTVNEIHARWVELARDVTLLGSERDAYNALAFEAAEHGAPCVESVMRLIRSNAKVTAQVRDALREGYSTPIKACQQLDSAITRMEIYFSELDLVKAAQ